MASSNPAGAKRLPTIFFTPGAWHEPWVFDSVRSALSARGFDSEVSPLVTVGCTDASVGLSADVAQTRSALMDVINQGKEVLVVAHSYGAIVASNAVEGLSVQQRAVGGKEGGVLMVLYLAGFVVPAKGSIMITLEGKYPPFWIISDDELFVSPRQPLDLLYADVEPSLAEKAVSSLRPTPVRIAWDVSAHAPWSEGFDVGYVFTEEDKAVDISGQKAMFSLFPAGSFSASLISSHSPFFSVPDALADTIQDAAEFVLKRRASS